MTSGYLIPKNISGNRLNSKITNASLREFSIRDCDDYLSHLFALGQEVASLSYLQRTVFFYTVNNIVAFCQITS